MKTKKTESEIFDSDLDVEVYTNSSSTIHMRIIHRPTGLAVSGKGKMSQTALRATLVEALKGSLKEL